MAIAPSRIATAASCALGVASAVTSGLVQIFVSTSGSLEGLTSAAAEALGVSLLVWVGIYFGARTSAPQQRSRRLVAISSFVFGFFGVLLSLPIKTHAVMLDMPSSVGPSGSHYLLMLIPIAVATVVILGPMFITRALAVMSGAKGA